MSFDMRCNRSWVWLESLACSQELAGGHKVANILFSGASSQLNYLLVELGCRAEVEALSPNLSRLEASSSLDVITGVIVTAADGESWFGFAAYAEFLGVASVRACKVTRTMKTCV